MRVVFDTNALVSALLFEDSTPARAFFFAMAEGKVLISRDLTSEIQRVLYQPKFDRYIEDSQREDFILSLVESAELINVTEAIKVCRDPKDDMILELAVSGNAEAIVTGDSDLLILHPFRGIKILSPQAFLATHKS